ncbi:unnamed protein product [Phyllotreta striolata]|uniref:Uncharacterized protein n=1 Tax=Phyllotreta striolata TaxID=444603 RepID=A0A9N9TL34_PHYSR|nr:unnamed protein product [Phyllotreta striolata]
MFIITFKLLLFASFSEALQCKDDNNNNVDWYMVYKIPSQSHSNNQLIKDGVAHIFLTSSDPMWKFSNKSIGDRKSIIGNTLRDLYENPADSSYLFYNDEFPDRKIEGKGHTKGVAATDKNGGYWLVHSVPLFPNSTENYFYPSTGTRYGQTFLCISMDLQNVNKVGLQLQYNQPAIYAKRILQDVADLAGHLAEAASGTTITSPPWYHLASIKSISNVEFLSFAKSERFNKELYVDLVAPGLQTDLNVETWPNGKGKLASNCTLPFKVKNVRSVRLEVAGVSFLSTHDHSKWAVSSGDGGKFWICIGDINREEHQLRRGGGTVCLDDSKIAGYWQKFVDSVENC